MHIPALMNNFSHSISFCILCFLSLSLTCWFWLNSFGLIISMLQIFAGAFPENYEPPPGGFYFEVNDDSPIVQVYVVQNWLFVISLFSTCLSVLILTLVSFKDDINLFDYNVQDRVNDFVAAAVSQVNRDGYLHVRIFPICLSNSFFLRSFFSFNCWLFFWGLKFLS